MRLNGYSLIFVLCLLIPTRLLAGPMAPLELRLQQPNGTTFIAIPRGDEYANWTETEDGHTIIKEGDTWYYAEKDGSGGLRASTSPVGSLGTDQLDLKPRHLAPAPNEEISKPNVLRKIPRLDKASTQAAAEGLAISHTQYVLTILVNYSNISLTYSDASFQSLIYGASNSVKDHFLKSSYNNFTIAAPSETSGTANDGIIRVTRPVPHPNHGNDFDIARPEAREITALADPFINFASFDTNADGSVSADELSIVIIPAGYENSYGGAGALTPNVFGHKSDFADLTLDGKILASYTMFGEAHAVSDDPSGKHITTIGIIAHELGHLMLGLPDLYDTDYTSKGIGDWGLMGSGEWNTTGGSVNLSPKLGDSPALMSAWSKVATGFTVPQDIDTDEAAILFPTQAAEMTKRIWIDKYRVFEYFLLENRQQTGYDQYLPWNGLLIWHADDRIRNNRDENYKLLDLEEADGLSQLDNNSSSGDALDPFPGLLNRTVFNDASNPNSKNNGSNATGIGVASIADVLGLYMTANVTALTGGLGDHIRYAERVTGNNRGYTNVTAWAGMRMLNDTGNIRFDGVDVYVNDPVSATVDIYYYTSMTNGVPSGLIHSQTGFAAVPGWNRLELTVPQHFPIGAERGIVLKIVNDSYQFPLSYDDSQPGSGRSYMSSLGGEGTTFFDTCQSFCRDFNIIALLSGANTAPSFTPAPAITLYQGTPAGSPEVVGTVSDSNTAAGALVVTQVVAGSGPGLNAGSITNTNGTVTATIETACDAASNPVRFKVSDGALSSTGDFLINILENTAPTLSYSDQAVSFGGSGSYSTATGPSDNVSVESMEISDKDSYRGEISVNLAGLVSISDAKPVGTHTITLRARDNCNVLKDATFELQVNALLPGAPVIGSASAGDQSASVSFSPPALDGGAAVTSYTVTSSPGGLTGSGAASPVTVPGLINGVAYTFSVTAENVAGNGPASSASNPVTPIASQTITFDNPGPQDFGTTPVLSATSTSGLTPTFGSRTEAVCTVTLGGTLTFLTTGSCAIDAKQSGNAAYRQAPTVTQTFNVNAVVPGAPVMGIVSAGQAQATIRFTPPVSNGGAAINGYEVTSSPEGIIVGGSGSPINVTGLTNDQTYTFTVTAKNTVGTGAPSSPSNPVTPAAQDEIFINGFEDQ